MGLVIKLLTTAGALMLASEMLPGITIDSLYIALIVGVLLGLASVTVRPLLILLTLPITVFTLGLFIFVINALILWFIASFVEGFTIDGFVPSLVTVLIISALHWLIEQLND